jgi:hypothetical protein
MFVGCSVPSISAERGLNFVLLLQVDCFVGYFPLQVTMRRFLLSQGIDLLFCSISLAWLNLLSVALSLSGCRSLNGRLVS